MTGSLLPGGATVPVAGCTGVRRCPILRLVLLRLLLRQLLRRLRLLPLLLRLRGLFPRPRLLAPGVGLLRL